MHNQLGYFSDDLKQVIFVALIHYPYYYILVLLSPLLIGDYSGSITYDLNSVQICKISCKLLTMLNIYNSISFLTQQIYMMI